eukprot:TRINITY_DN48044_c0_g1_i1.p1 TRINITY_DN48044_c0_g1~~TRINITY_DN48044_c0_g1_i1.p1  ORF type:complete len:277 (-),score=41.66 TRINITY_DN48044_c0_g1_i1:9-839(-)
MHLGTMPHLLAPHLMWQPRPAILLWLCVAVLWAVGEWQRGQQRLFLARGHLSSGLTAPARSARTARRQGPHPELCVFDLDACLWDKEMFEMEAMPLESGKVRGDLRGRGQGVVGVMSGYDKISLHEGALIALQEHADGRYPGMKLAVASSADTPFAVKVGRAALAMLEVLPGLTVWELLLRDWEGQDVNQIGRSPPLSANKAQTHFPRLKAATGVAYDKMLFFDDCNWGDHCGKVAAACREPNGDGVVTIRTPHGLREREWRQGIECYAHETEQRR